MTVGAVAGNSNVMQVKNLMGFTSAAMKAAESSVANGQQVGNAIGKASQISLTA